MISRLKGLIFQDDFWHGNHKIFNKIPDDGLENYYVDLSKKCIKNDLSLNEIEEFVPKVSNKFGESIHPVTVCQVGLGCIEYFHNKSSKEHLKRAVLCADWLLQNSENINSDKANKIYWTVPYPFKLFNLEKNFRSGLIQGQAISLLLRIFKVTKEIKYFTAADKACNFMMTPVTEGGCFNTKLNLIEEYVNDKYDVSVLNGAISASWAINDMWLVTKEIKHKANFRFLQSSLIKIISKFDTGYWSRYCLIKNNFKYCSLASKYYHEEHIIQLKIMHMITGEEEWLNYSEKFSCYSKNNFVNYYVFIRKAIARMVQEALSLV